VVEDFGDGRAGSVSRGTLHIRSADTWLVDPIAEILEVSLHAARRAWMMARG
jgi:hypothetical protein